MSLGEQRIGKFNNESRDDVGQIKMLASELIDLIDKECPDGRRKSKAISKIETAQMYAVKSLFDG